MLFGLITLAVFGLVALRFPQFATPAALAELLDDTAILILLALGQMFVLLTRGVDLSIASNLALSGMLAALVSRQAPELGVTGAVLIAIASGILLGACNGILVWKLRLPPIVVTLGTLSIYRGLVFLLTSGAWVNSHELAPAFLSATRVTFLGLTVVAWLAMLSALACWAALRYTRFGRDLLASGGNPQAAAYVGIDAGRLQCAAFTLAGGLAGLCGYLWVSRYAVAYTDIALGFELQVIAACLIGGVSIAGGVGGVVGVMLGCLFLGIVKNALPIAGISPFWQLAMNGLVITVAVILNARADRSQRRAIVVEETP